MQIGSMKTWGAIATTPLVLFPAAWMSAIDAPSEWPTSTGFSTPVFFNNSGNAISASSCMNRTLRRFSFRTSD